MVDHIVEEDINRILYYISSYHIVNHKIEYS